jgi:hypothetical protein
MSTDDASTEPTTKTIVTVNERLQLIGLLTLAARHNAALKEIKTAVRELVGEVDEDGHAVDAVYNDDTADELLRRLKLTVENPFAGTPFEGHQREAKRDDE